MLDISALFGSDEGEVQELARKWDAMLQKMGFVVIVGHNVPAEIGENAYSTAKEFFALPTAEKMKAKYADHYGPGGYLAKGSLARHLFVFVRFLFVCLFVFMYAV